MYRWLSFKIESVRSEIVHVWPGVSCILGTSCLIGYRWLSFEIESVRSEIVHVCSGVSCILGTSCIIV